jgi:tyrosyl-tRNA synthetase
MRLEREHHLSFLEFNYMVLQAYDFTELARRHDCILQMGGSDQWGNIVAGIELGRKMDDRALFAVTTPLITTSSGAKMGKTASGAVWLNADRVTPYAYWQFWRDVEDADVGRFLGLFTELPLDEVKRLAALKGAEINEAKKVLANEATALLHGRTAADEAAETARRTFEEVGMDSALPTVEIPRQEFVFGIALTTLLVRAGLASSNGEARRAIANNAVSVNDKRVAEATATVSAGDLNTDGVAKLSHGRKKHVLVKAI